MADRLTKIYTRSGDTGSTRLANGEKISKTDALIETFGAVDELNSALGLALSHEELPGEIRQPLSRIQNELFDIGAELSLPGHVAITAASVDRLEQELDTLNAELPTLREFILPGGNQPASACHLARSICRRAERRAWALAETTDVNAELLKYLNRLSDLLFVVARIVARQNGSEEVLWRSKRS